MDDSVSVFYSLAVLVAVVVAIVGSWKMFEKADEPGWKSIIPLYNMYTYFRIAGRSGWMFLLLLIPLVNIVISIVVALDLAKQFDKGGAFGFFLLWLFPYVGTVVLGFGDAEYVGTKHE